MLHHRTLVLLLFLLLLNHALPSLVKLHKPRILRILESFSNMEGKWQVIEYILADKGVVLLKIVEEGFLVAEVEVVD